MRITEVYNTGFTVYCDAFAIKSYSSVVYFLSLTGAVSAVQSIIASLLEGHGVTIYGEEINKVVYLPYKTKFKMISRRLPSKNQHLIFYPEIALPTNDSREFLILAQDNSLAPKTFFKYLNARTSVPLHQSWDTWLWKKLLEDECIEELDCWGIYAYLCSINETELAKLITSAVKSKKLKVKNLNGNKEVVKIPEKLTTPELPEPNDSFSPMRRIQRPSAEMPYINERIAPRNR